MAYDEQLADRIREILGGEPDLSEKEMFGGLGFMLSRRMAVAANSEGTLMVRIDPSEADALLDGERVRLVEMRGRQMRGWLHVEPEVVAGDRELREMVGRGAAYVRSLLDS
ncbi:MAG: TfoX/Sxy family protein [Micrococcales bacterium]|nr:TfoX/Sxy family protein [Micrococcales bacterium]